MARSPEANASAGFRVDSAVVQNSQQLSDDFPSDDRAMDSPYQEVTSTQRVPTKSGEEEGMHVDTDRPGSAGSSNSLPLPDEDVAILADTSASKSQEIDPTPVPFMKRPSLSRDFSQPLQDSSATFTFGQHQKRPMDLHGKRTYGTVTPAANPSKQQSGAADQRDDDGPSLAEKESQITALPESELSDASFDQQLTEEHKRSSDTVRNSKSTDIAPIVEASVEHSAEAYDASKGSSPNETETGTAQHLAPHEDEEHFEEATESMVAASERETEPYSQKPQAVPPQVAVEPRNYQTQLQDVDTSTQSARNAQGPSDAQPNYLDTQFDPNQAQSRPLQSHTAPQRHIDPSRESLSTLPAQHQMPAPSRPGKARSKNFKKSRKAPAPVADVDTEINDYMQIMMYKIRQQSQTSINKIALERDDARQQLYQVLEAKRTLEDQLEGAYQDNNDLSSTCDKQKTKLASYESRVRKLKTFVDGLGRDLDNHKREANAIRRKGEQLLEEGREYKQQYAGLRQQMQACAEQSAQLKEEAKSTCNIQLEAAKAEISHLEGRLSENVGVLTEERDRRNQLERRLEGKNSLSDEVLRAMKANSDAVVDKLHIMHAIMESSEANDKLSNDLSQVLDMVHAMSSQTTAGEKDAAATKELVASLNDRLAEVNHQALMEPLQTQLNEVISGLKQLADQQAECNRQAEAHRESMSGLQEQLRDSNVRATNLQAEVQILQNREALLKEESQKLQSRISALQTQPNSHPDAQNHLSEAKVELHEKVRALESAHNELTSKNAALEALRKANEDLDLTAQKLREKISELERTADRLLPEQHATEEKHRKEVERVRAESLKHSQDYRAQLDMDSKNQLKKLTSDRDRLEKQVAPLKAELSNSKKAVSELQKRIENATETNDQLEQSKALNCSQTKEIEALKASLSSLHQSANVDTSLREKLAGLQSALETETSKLGQAVNEATVLKQQLESHQDEANKAREACEQVKEELATYRDNAEKELQQRREELASAEEARRRAEAGQELLRKSCDTTLEEEKAKSRRVLEESQTSLAQAQADLKEAQANDESFRAEIEKQWMLDKSEHDQQLEDLRRQIREAEDAKQEAVANGEHAVEERKALLDQVDELKQRLASAEEMLKSHQESAAKVVESSRREVPGLSDGITPSASEASTQPTRPRKKVDRNYNSTLDSSAVPVPEVLRQSSHRPNSSRAHLEPVIQDSQDVETQKTGADAAVDIESGDFSMFPNPEQVLQIDQTSASQQRTQRIEETQVDSLPSFSAFKNSLSAGRVPGLNRVSSSLSMAYGNSQQTAFRESQGPALTKKPSDPVFSIYEDTQDGDTGVSRGSLHMPLQPPQNDIDWSQEEREKYTYHKAKPQPNSASKLVRADSQNSVGVDRRSSALPTRTPLGERRLQTPEGRIPSSSQLSSAPSSSPAYAQPSTSLPGRTYSQARGDSVQRRSSRTQVASSQDPRLAGRNPPPAPKRKAENVVEGYEHERKKRMSQVSSGPAPDTHRFSLRSNSNNRQQSIRDLPDVPATPMNPRGSASQSRLRTLGGGSSRATGPKRVSKGDEFNVRFSQELNRR